jgi:predicted small metal-binding protein
MLRLRCAEVVPGCDRTFEAADEEGILRQVMVHAREAHGMDELPPEIGDRVVASMQEVSSDGQVPDAGAPPAPAG